MAFLQLSSLALFADSIAFTVRTLNVPCAGLVPSGPAYPNIDIANQVCPTLGSETGNAIVNGSAYLQASFGYTWSNAWRNFGIIIGYLVFFLAVNVYTTEVQKDESATGGVVLFKRGSAPKEVADAAKGVATGDDEEKGASAAPRLEDNTTSEKRKEEAADTLQAASDIFTWQNVNYDVQVKGGTRRLLDNVSGYVQPGRMTCCEFYIFAQVYQLL